MKKLCREFHGNEEGAATAEYAITILAAVGFAGLLTAVLTSDAVRGWLLGIVQKALGS
jgi:Flp pilus assembly pilin Flp